MRIYLRPVSLQDGALIVKWRNTIKVSSHSFSRKPITIESNKLFYEKNVSTGKYHQFIVECVEEISGVASYPIATVYLKDIDKENKRK